MSNHNFPPQYGDRVPCGECDGGMFIYGAMHVMHKDGDKCHWHHLLSGSCQLRNRCLEELPQSAIIEKYNTVNRGIGNV